MHRNLAGFAPGLAALVSYKKSNLRFDIAAGLPAAAVALAVGNAYAEIARVPAVVGIYSAIFPLFAYALFGSSRQLMTDRMLRTASWPPHQSERSRMAIHTATAC